jgi:hypothetical protein
VAAGFGEGMSSLPNKGFQLPSTRLGLSADWASGIIAAGSINNADGPSQLKPIPLAGIGRRARHD